MARPRPALRIGARSPPACEAGDIASVAPLDGDADPSPLLGNLPGSIRHRSARSRPLRSGAAGCATVRAPVHARGADEFVAVSWDELTELLADELRRVVDVHGNEAIYGGSYGWASAGRFHHAQSQVHRFLKLLGGYTFSRHSYSLGATGVIMPRVVGTHDDLFKRSTDWDVIVEHTDLLVCFGGIGAEEHRHQPRRHHRASGPRRACAGSATAAAGSCRSPRCGTTSTASASGTHRYPAPTWRSCWPSRTCWPPRSLADRDFLDTYCTGYDRFERYLLGADDGVPKSPQWAAAICGLAADDLTALARRMAAGRTIVTVSWSLQRIRHGEQAPWMGLTLAAMLGQIGLPGGGFGHGYGSMNEPGLPPLRCSSARHCRRAPTRSDVHPRRRGQRHAAAPRRAVRLQRAARSRTPTSSCVYWAGGNPVSPPPEHRPAAAGAGPGRHRRRSRPVLDGDGQARRHRGAVDHARSNATTSPAPATTRCWWRCPQLAEPYAQSRDDYATFTALAERLGFAEQFTEGRTARQWLAHMYDKWAAGLDFDGADVRRVLAAGQLRLPTEAGLTLLGRLPRRPADPSAGHPQRTHRDLLRTTSTGSATTTARATRSGTSPTEWLGGARAADVSAASAGQSARDRGCTASSTVAPPVRPPKYKGANPSGCTRPMPTTRGLVDGDVVRVFNDRGACLAGVVRRRPRAPRGGAAVDRGLVRPARTRPTRMRCACTATRTCSPTDVGTSSLARGCTGAHVLVQIEKFDGPLPPVRAHEPPMITPRR